MNPTSNIAEVRLALSLLKKKKASEFVIEGERLIREANDLICFLLYAKESPLVKWVKDKNKKTIKISKQETELLSSVITTQGVIAVANKPEFDISDIYKKKNPLLVLCAGIQDPGNLGTIIRCADAACADAVLLSKGTVELYNQKVIRSTMGSIFHLPVIECQETEKVIKELKSKGIRVIAADASGKRNLWEENYKSPTAIVIGNEGAGIPDNILDLCDNVASVPILGKAESLNAAMTASIFLYEAVRQRWLKE